MDIISWEDFARGGLKTDSAVTIGVFDGIHRGHQALISKINQYKQNGARSLVVTFRQNPRRALFPERETRDIISLDEKISILAGLGVDALLLIDFSAEFGKIDGEDFIKTLALNAGMRFLAIGRDFKCGYRGAYGTAQIQTFCRDNSITCEIVEPVMEGGEPVSSSRIRRALAAGDKKTAELLLGRTL